MYSLRWPDTAGALFRREVFQSCRSSSTHMGRPATDSKASSDINGSARVAAEGHVSRVRTHRSGWRRGEGDGDSNRGQLMSVRAIGR